MKIFTDDTDLIVILEKGEEIISSLTEACKKNNIRSGFLTGIGAGEHFEIGYYDVTSKNYIRRSIPGEYEITSMTGSISVKDGEILPHVHINLADSSFHLFGGHLFKGTITGTCEIYIKKGKGKLIRKLNKNSNLSLIEKKEEE